MPLPNRFGQELFLCDHRKGLNFCISGRQGLTRSWQRILLRAEFSPRIIDHFGTKIFDMLNVNAELVTKMH